MINYMDVSEVIERLHTLKDPDKIAFKRKKFGVVANNSLGIYQKDLKELSRELKKNSELAKALFDTDIYEARVLCSKIFDPKELNSELMEKWVVTFENWEICDSFSMGLFSKSELAEVKIREWAKRSREFEKRAGFATISSYCMANKKASNSTYENFFPLIIEASTDERIYVKKAVNWALRSIGKRNVDLNKKALEVAHLILQNPSKSAQWIAKNAIRELSGKKLNVLDYPRSIYRV
jgi:3-methyladenine DNA glycosylase AlkD